MTKTTSNSPYIFIVLVLTLAVTALLSLAQPATADIIDITKNPNTFNPVNIDKTDTFRCLDPTSYKYTEQIILCFNQPIRNAVLDPTNGLLIKVSDIMSDAVLIVIVVVIAAFGVRMLGAEQQLSPRGLALLLRIGIMLFLVNGLGGYAGALFDIFDELVTVVTPNNFNPWQSIDIFLGELLGFPTADFQTRQIKDGIIGLLEGSLFAKNFGAMLTVVGGFAVLGLLIFIFQAVYLYISSVLAIGFLIIITPVIFPFIVFERTRGFLDRWLNLYISSLLTPMLMFSMLYVFIIPNTDDTVTPQGIFKTAIDDIIVQLGGTTTSGTDYMQRCLHNNQPIVFSASRATDPNLYNELTGLNPEHNLSLSPLAAPVQSFYDPNLQKAFENKAIPAPIPTNVPIVDCGTTYSATGDKIDIDKEMKDKILKDLLVILIFAVLMNAMLSKIPIISADMTSGATTGVSNLISPLTRMINLARR